MIAAEKTDGLGDGGDGWSQLWESTIHYGETV